jgi:hypothetical protein
MIILRKVRAVGQLRKRVPFGSEHTPSANPLKTSAQAADSSKQVDKRKGRRRCTLFLKKVKKKPGMELIGALRHENNPFVIF